MMKEMTLVKNALIAVAVLALLAGCNTIKGMGEDIKAAGGCPKGNINAQKDGVVTRAILFDGTRLPGKATPPGWLDPGTAIHREDLEALEKLEHVKVSAGDVILLYTGRWKRRAALGPWPNATGFAGYHADVAYFIRTRRFIHRRRWTE